MNNTYHLYSKDASGGICKLSEISHFEHENSISLSHTNLGNKYFKSLLPQEESINLALLSTRKLGILLGLNEPNGDFDKMINSASENGSFIITKNEEYNSHIGKIASKNRTAHIASRDFGKDLFSTNSKGKKTNTILTGDILGERMATIQTVGEHADKEEKRKLAIKYAMNVALGKKAIFKEDRRTTTPVLVTNMSDHMSGFAKTEMGVMTKEENMLSNSLLSINDLRTIETGKESNDDFESSFKSAFRLMRAAPESSRMALVTETCLNALCGGNRLNGDSIKFQTTISEQSGKISLKAIGIQDFGADLMFGATHTELAGSNFSNTSPKDFSLRDLLVEHPYLSEVMRSEPQLLESSFNAAKAALANIPDILERDVESEILSLRGISQSFKSYMSNTITPESEIGLLNSYDFTSEDEHPDEFLKRIMGNDEAFNL